MLATSVIPTTQRIVQGQVRITRSDDGHLLTVTPEGHYTLPEIMASLRAALEEAPPDRDCCLLMDIRQSETIPTQGEIQAFAAFLATLPTDVATRAAWVVSEDLRFGLARQLSVFAEEHGIEIQVFRDTTPELEWLEDGHAEGHTGA